MGDMVLVEGNNEFNIALQPVAVGVATIEGLVTDYWGKPLANIRVLLSEYINAGRTFITDAKTDSIGFYRFTVDLPVGKKYRVYCDSYAQGYWSSGKDCVTVPGINSVDFWLTKLL